MNDFWLLPMAGNPEAGSNGWLMIGWFGLIFGLIYLTMIRPQRKRQKDHDTLVNALKKGDKVVTNSGLFGTIFAIEDDKGQVVLKTDGDTKLRFLKTSISARVGDEDK